MPRITLENSVTELLDAMAGASTPVLSADCCSANPVTAERISTYTDQLLSSGEHAAADLGDEGLGDGRLQAVAEAGRGAEGQRLGGAR